MAGPAAAAGLVTGPGTGLRRSAGIIADVTVFYDIDRANARLPDVRAILEQLRSERRELISLRDRLVVRAAGRRLRPTVERSSTRRSARRPTARVDRRHRTLPASSTRGSGR